MKSYKDIIRNLGVEFPKELAINMAPNPVYISYHYFIMNYNINNLDKTLMELHGLLKTSKDNMLKTKSSNTFSSI